MNQSVNPYASPADPIPLVQPDLASTKQGPPFQSGAGRARFTMIMLGLCAAFDVLIGVSTLPQIQLLESADPLVGIDPTAATANDIRQNVIVFTALAITIVTGIAYSFWVYRAHQNLPSLGAASIEYSPGWAVGSFFVPILNLFRPCQIMLEIWRGSDPERLSPMGTPHPETIVGWWWGLWVTAGIADRISGSLSRSAETIPDLKTSSWLVIAVAALGVPLAIVALLMVRTVDRHQTARYAKVVATQVPLPSAWNVDLLN